MKNMNTTDSTYRATDADRVMLTHYNELISEMTSCYRNVLESDGAIQYKIYIWDNGEIETLEGPDGDNSALVARSHEERSLYHVATVRASCVDVFDLAGMERPEDPTELENAKAEAIDYLVDNYIEEAEAKLDAAIDEAKEN